MSTPGTEPFPGIQFVFLDRDGVINRKAAESEYIFRWEDFDPLPGAEKGIAALKRSGKHVIVLTNQRGVSLGRYTIDQVTQFHARLQQHLAAFGAHVDAFYVCPHGQNECRCRKPKTGLIEQAFRDFPDATKQNSLVIGDSLSDIQLARTFGVPSILIRNPDRSQTQDDQAATLASATTSSLWEAVTTIVCLDSDQGNAGTRSILK